MPYPDFTPLYTEQKDNPQPLDLGQYKPSFAEEMKAWFAASWNLNPTVAGSRAYDVMTRSSGVDLDTFQDMSDADVVEFAQNYSPPPDRVPVEAQEKLFEENGLAGHLKADTAYTMPALQEIMDAKHEELLNAEVINRGSHGVLGLGMGFVAGALDPVNVVSSLIPVVGEARIAGMLANAGSFMGRTGVRLGVGALSGAAGAAMVEPVIWSAASIAQADYGMMNSIANIFFGAGLGAGLRGVGGGIAEGVRNLRGKRQPWEFVPPDEAESAGYMRKLEENIYNVQRELNPDALPRTLREQARTYAATFDAFARQTAWHQRTSIKSVYDSYPVSWHSWQDFEPQGWRDLLPDSMRSMDGLGHLRGYEDLPSLNADGVPIREFMENMGEWEKRFPEMEDWQGIRKQIEDLQQKGGASENGAGPDVLNHAAMYLDPETDYLAFTQKSRNKKGKQSYFILNDPELPENVRLRSDLFKHEKNRHDNLTDEDNLRLPIILKQINGKNTIVVGNWKKGGVRHLGVQTVDGVHYGYVFDVHKSGVVDVVTFFKDSLSGLKEWATGENKKRTAQVVRKQDSNQLAPDSPFYMGQSAEKNLADFVEQVKNKLNTVLSHYSSPTLPGKQAKLLGPNLDETVRYEVRELDDILPSHDPESNFQKNANYPEKTQERQYHSDIGEQEKVIANASENRFEPGHLLSDDLTVAGGPPIVTDNGIVPGGNSRTMMLKLVYGRNAGKAQAYRDALKVRGQYFGINPARIDGMKKPVLVRAVAGKMGGHLQHG